MSSSAARPHERSVREIVLSAAPNSCRVSLLARLARRTVPEVHRRSESGESELHIRGERWCLEVDAITNQLRQPDSKVRA